MQLRRLFLTASGGTTAWNVTATSAAGGVGVAVFSQPLPSGAGVGGIMLAGTNPPASPALPTAGDGGGETGIAAMLVASLGGPLSFRFWSSTYGAPALATYHPDFTLNASQAMAVPVPTVGSFDTIAFTALAGVAQIGVSVGWIVSTFDLGVVEVVTSHGPL